MSYCRFSSDNWKSDVYVYADVSGGWTTHVASSRRAHRTPCPPAPLRLLLQDQAAYQSAYAAQMAWLDGASLVKIDLPHAGESFTDGTPGECAARLLSLRQLGYHVPQNAIDMLLAEGDGEEEDDPMSCRLHDEPEVPDALQPIKAKAPVSERFVIIALATCSMVLMALAAVGVAMLLVRLFVGG